jgi:hypothetical protein
MIDDKEIVDTLFYVTQRFNSSRAEGTGVHRELLRAHIFELVALIDIICELNGRKKEATTTFQEWWDATYPHGKLNAAPILLSKWAWEAGRKSLEQELNGCWKKHYKMCVYGLGEDRKPKHKKGGD